MWTQLKVGQIFDRQKPSTIQDEAAEFRKCDEEEESDEDKKKRPQSIMKKGERKESESLNFEYLHKIVKTEDKTIVKRYLEKHQLREKKAPRAM